MPFRILSVIALTCGSDSPLHITKKSVYDEFRNKVETIYTGFVHQIQRNRIFINDENKNELILPKSGQIPNDRYKRGQQVRGLIESVDYSIKGLEIILSRSSNLFLKRLFQSDLLYPAL